MGVGEGVSHKELEKLTGVGMQDDREGEIAENIYLFNLFFFFSSRRRHTR